MFLHGRAQLEMEFGLCSSMAWNPRGFGVVGIVGFPKFQPTGRAALPTWKQEETGTGWQTLGMCLGICFCFFSSHRSELSDDDSTWNDAIPPGRKEGMELLPAAFPSLPPHGIHRAPGPALPKKTPAALAVSIFCFQQNLSSVEIPARRMGADWEVVICLELGIIPDFITQPELTGR